MNVFLKWKTSLVFDGRLLKTKFLKKWEQDYLIKTTETLQGLTGENEDEDEEGTRLPGNGLELVKQSCFHYNRIKKGEGQGKYVTFSTMIHKEVGERLKMTTHHVPLRQMIECATLEKVLKETLCYE